MAGPWIVDGNRFASKIRNASGVAEPEIGHWKSNPAKACPKCHHLIDNTDVAQEWPGLPRGVKFDPTDQEIVWHLLAKVGIDGLKPHLFIDEFIPTVDKNDGICYTHPQNLPGVKQDGTVAHFFHRAIKAYNTGTRKRRKIQGDNLGDVRWHKTGRTKPVILDGIHRGCKKIMVLYMSTARGGKAEKTNWVMHQYHLGTEEDERDGEYIISKIFYQQQQTNKGEKCEEGFSAVADSLIVKVDPNTPKSATPEPPCTERRSPDFDLGIDFTTASDDPCLQFLEISSSQNLVDCLLAKEPDKDKEQDPKERKVKKQYGLNYVQDSSKLILQCKCENCLKENKGKAITKVDPNTPQSVTPDPPRSERRSLDFDLGIDFNTAAEDPTLKYMKGGNVEDEVQSQSESILGNNNLSEEKQAGHMADGNENAAGEDPKWWDSESQNLLDSQQLVEAISLCEEFLESQSPKGNQTATGKKPSISDYAQLGPEYLKKDLEDCQNLNLVVDPANIDLDTPPDFRLSQLEFGSQDSFVAWGCGKAVD